MELSKVLFLGGVFVLLLSQPFQPCLDSLVPSQQAEQDPSCCKLSD